MKFHRIKLAIFKQWIGLMALMGMAAGVYAQSAAEIGAMHNNCNHPNYQGDRSRCGGGNRAPVYAEVWENRFGAIAVDYEQGKSGIAESKKSARIARNEASKSCGTKNCKIVARIRNGCLVATYGGGFAYGGGATMDIAIEDAMSICQADGSKCEIQYSGCSLPVRVR